MIVILSSIYRDVIVRKNYVEKRLIKMFFGTIDEVLME